MPLSRRRVRSYHSAAAAGAQFSDDFSGTLAQWTTTLVGTGAFVDITAGALRVGTTGSFGTVNAQAKTTNAFILGDAGVHDVIIEWTAASAPSNAGCDLWVVDASGNGFGIQTFNGVSFSLQSVTVAANVASVGIAFLAVGAVPSPVSGSPAPLYLRFSQNGTNWAIAYSTSGLAGSWTAWTSGTLASASNPVTSAMKLVVIGHANGTGAATEYRYDNVRWA